MILAATSAKLIVRPGADELLEEALTTYDRHFWDDEIGLAVDTWNTEFTKLDSYRSTPSGQVVRPVPRHAVHTDSTSRSGGFRRSGDEGQSEHLTARNNKTSPFSPPIREEPRSLHKATGVLRISNQITQRMQFTYFQPRLHHYLMIGRRGADTSTLCLSPITFGSLMILSTTAFFNLRSEESPHTITRSPPLISVVMES